LAPEDERRVLEAIAAMPWRRAFFGRGAGDMPSTIRLAGVTFLTCRLGGPRTDRLVNPNATDQFFTLSSLGTLAGASGATFIVTNTLKTAFGLAPKWAGLVVAQVICVGLAIMTQRSGSDYVIAVLNGCLVFLSAAGAAEASGVKDRKAAARRMGARTRGGPDAVPGAGAFADAPEKPPFLSSWF